VLLVLARGAPHDPRVLVEDEAGGARRSLVDAEDHSRRNLTPAGAPRDPQDVDELAAAVEEAGKVTAGRPVLERELDEAQSGAMGVDGHGGLHRGVPFN